MWKWTSFKIKINLIQVLQRAADRALAKLENQVLLDDGQVVEVTRSINNPYTLNITPTWGGICTDRMEIDMVAAFEIPISILPDETRNRVLQVQERVGIVEEKCLAVALPVVNKELFQVTKNTSCFLKKVYWRSCKKL